MNEHRNMRTIWQVASLIEDGATSEQIEVELSVSIKEVHHIREHLATPEEAPGQPGTRTTPKEAAFMHFIHHHMESSSSGQEAPTSEEIRNGCGIETWAEMDQLAARLLEKGFITTVEEAPPEDGTQNPSSLIGPAQWQGPTSSLVAALLDQQPGDDTQTQLTETLLHLVLRKDTLRILMDSELITRLHRAAMDPSWQPPEYSPGWPHRGPVYIEISPPLTEEVTRIKGEMHGLIITEDTGMDLRGVLAPSILNGRVELMAMTIRLIITEDTGMDLRGVLAPSILNGRVELMAMTIRPTNWDPEALDELDVPAMRHLFLLLTALVVFLTDDRTEIVPRPLTRTQKRRLARTGRTNPWHIIRSNATN